MLPKNVFSVFPPKSTLTIRGISVTRLQIPMTPRFAVTDYKVQGATFRTVILDLHRHSKCKDKSSYKRFYSTYVELSHLQTLDRVRLLQPITLNDIRSKPHLKLQDENLKMDNRLDQTLLL